MRFRLDIATDNAAFEDGGAEVELTRILRGVADKIESGGGQTSGPLRDSNGNRVGSWELEQETGATE